MKTDPFDSMLERRRKRMTDADIDALIDVNDTLEFARASAENLFGKSRVTPSSVIAIGALMLARLPIGRRKRLGVDRPL